MSDSDNQPVPQCCGVCRWWTRLGTLTHQTDGVFDDYGSCHFNARELIDGLLPACVTDYVLHDKVMFSKQGTSCPCFEERGDANDGCTATPA